MSTSKIGDGQRKRRAGKCFASPALVEDRLKLPDDVSIVGAAWDFDSSCVILYIEGESLREIEEGQIIPRVTVWYEVQGDEIKSEIRYEDADK